MPGEKTVVLVEGESDRNALITLAGRKGRDLEAEGVEVVPMGGASLFADHLRRHVVETRRDPLVAGLCDLPEVDDLRRGLEAVGMGSSHTIAQLEDLGFYVCVDDLEDELIRAIGTPGVEELFDREGELRSFRIMQSQPAWRGRDTRRQMRRFIGARSGRKIRYGRLLVETVDLARVPLPLEGLLASI